MLKLTINLLERSSWIEAKISNDTKEVSVFANHFTDALIDLVAPTKVVLEGMKEKTCSWQDEPGEYRWLFIKDNQKINITILFFEELFSRKANKQGKVLL